MIVRVKLEYASDLKMNWRYFLKIARPIFTVQAKRRERNVYVNYWCKIAVPISVIRALWGSKPALK